MPQQLLKFIPNLLTLARLILIWPFLFYLLNHQYMQAFYLLVMAGCTDGLDGWLARYFGWQSPLGKFMDPLADKLLVSLSFVSLALLNQLPWWLVILVLMRDITIAMGVMLWYFLITEPINFSPTALSKVNTLLQLSLVTLCVFKLVLATLPNVMLTWLIVLTASTTLITYVHYVFSWGKKAYSFYKIA
ncbi:MAG: phosphatidylglycerophosphate synthase [Legionellales bacterium RIFCSPHIGHO2_12_FULL_42_9]|nr:MAG: phosphatidylglycerophosphate synthase [Legionellales bacterium RIFCSPHIGHO2_12_FULL_42_9]